MPAKEVCEYDGIFAPPSPEYARKLGNALYQMAGLEWLAIEIVRRLEPATPINMLAGLTAQGIADQFTSKVSQAKGLRDVQREELVAIAAEYAYLPSVRNDTVHARPATAPDGQQQLYRWAPTKSGFVGFIDETFLDQLLADIDEVGRRMDATRSWLPSAE